MQNTNWLKQTPSKPLFPDLLWSRPENKQARGKLLVAGGNFHSFSAVSSAYEAAQKAGAGTARILLPDALAKSLSKFFPEAEFASTTPSGSFAKAALAQFLDLSNWSDAVLLAGDFGKNSETAVLLESFVQKYQGQLTLVGDSLDYFLNNAEPLLKRAQTNLVVSLTQLQKMLAGRALIKHSMNLAQLVDTLIDIKTCSQIITYHNGQIIVCSDGKISTMPCNELNFQALASYISVWNLQQPSKMFEALSCAVYCFVSDQ